MIKSVRALYSVLLNQLKVIDMIYSKMSAYSVSKTNNDKPKFTTTPRKVENVEEKAKKTRSKKTEVISDGVEE